MMYGERDCHKPQWLWIDLTGLLDFSVLEENGENGDETKWTDSRYLVMVETKDLVDGLAVGML